MNKGISDPFCHQMMNKKERLLLSPLIGKTDVQKMIFIIDSKYIMKVCVWMCEFCVCMCVCVSYSNIVHHRIGQATLSVKIMNHSRAIKYHEEFMLIMIDERVMILDTHEQIEK